jgi:hypothetical protein
MDLHPNLAVAAQHVLSAFSESEQGWPEFVKDGFYRMSARKASCQHFAAGALFPGNLFPP